MAPQPDRDYVDYASGQMARLHRVAYFMCGDLHRAEDLVQATLVSLYAAWNSAKYADNLDAYVHRILVRRFIDEKRSAWSRVLLRDRLPDKVEESGDGVTDRATIVAALRALPVGQRAVVVLRYYSDLSVEHRGRPWLLDRQVQPVRSGPRQPACGARTDDRRWRPRRTPQPARTGPSRTRVATDELTRT